MRGKKLLIGMLALSVISSNSFASGSGGMVWKNQLQPYRSQYQDLWLEL